MMSKRKANAQNDISEPNAGSVNKSSLERSARKGRISSNKPAQQLPTKRLAASKIPEKASNDLLTAREDTTPVPTKITTRATKRENSKTTNSRSNSKLSKSAKSLSKLQEPSNDTNGIEEKSNLSGTLKYDSGYLGSTGAHSELQNADSTLSPRSSMTATQKSVSRRGSTSQPKRIRRSDGIEETKELATNSTNSHVDNSTLRGKKTDKSAKTPPSVSKRRNRSNVSVDLKKVKQGPVNKIEQIAVSPEAKLPKGRSRTSNTRQDKPSTLMRAEQTYDQNTNMAASVEVKEEMSLIEPRSTARRKRKAGGATDIGNSTKSSLDSRSESPTLSTENQSDVQESKKKAAAPTKSDRNQKVKSKRGKAPAKTQESTQDEGDGTYSKAEPQGNDNTGALKKVFKMLGGKVACHHCQKQIRTPAYYHKHVEWCKSDHSLMEMCDICNRQFKAFWLNEHKFNCAKKMAEKECAASLPKSAKPTAAVTPGSKRQAAAKALSMIKNITNEKEEIDWKSMFTTPHMTEPSQEVVSGWQQCLDDSKVLTCTHEGCKVQETTIERIETHYWTCPFNGLDCHTWNCKKCTKSFHSEKDAFKHVKSKHSPKTRDKKTQDVDYKSDEQSQTDEDDDVSSGVPTEDEDDQALSANESEGERPRPSGGKDVKAICQYIPVGPSASEKLCNSIHLSKATRLPGHLPNKERLFETKCEGLPKTASIRFKTDKNPEIHQLNIGETISSSGGYVTYVGEAIKAVEWCPISHDVEKDVMHTDQHIAVIASNVTCTDLRDIYSFSESIQVWKITNFSRRSKEPIDISLCLTLTHHFGYIHQMKWCYDGGFLMSDAESGVHRLGLLALAASDGSVHITGVPYIDCPKETGIRTSCTIDQDLTLSVAGNKAQCICVDWQRGDNKFVFAGFSDGSAAVWYVGGDLQSKVLHPVKVFRAHITMVNDIICCPFNSDLFATFSHGWLLWDLKNLVSPYLTPKSIDWCLGLHTKAVWPRIHQIVISCTDPSFGAFPLSLLSLGYDFIIANQKSPIRDIQLTTDVDVCDCCNVLVVGGACGTIGYHTPIVPKYVKGTEKGSGERSHINMSAMQTLQSEGDDEHEDDVITFEYLKTKKLRFHGTKNTQFDVKVLAENKRTHSINSVSMNPNAAAHGWLLGGGEHGLLHLIDLSKMLPSIHSSR